MDNVEGGRAYDVLGYDLIGLSGAFLLRWDTIGPNVLMPKKVVEAAAKVGNDILTTLSLDVVKIDKDGLDAVEVRQRWYTLTKWTYTDLRKAAIYAIGDTVDVDALIPPFNQGRSKKSSAATDAPTPEVDVTPTVTETPVTEPTTDAPSHGESEVSEVASTDVASTPSTDTPTTSPCGSTIDAVLTD